MTLLWSKFWSEKHGKTQVSSITTLIVLVNVPKLVIGTRVAALISNIIGTTMANPKKKKKKQQQPSTLVRYTRSEAAEKCKVGDICGFFCGPKLGAPRKK